MNWPLPKPGQKPSWRPSPTLYKVSAMALARSKARYSNCATAYAGFPPSAASCVAPKCSRWGKSTTCWMARSNMVRCQSEEERDKIAEADLIVRGKDRKTGTDIYLVLEVSWGVGPSDIERAAERAALLTKLGTPALPAVRSEEITREAREKAQAKGVWQFINGTVVPATS